MPVDHEDTTYTLYGIGRSGPLDNEPDEPGWQRKLAVGLAACAAAARKWRTD